jgi:hypothetical protein
MFGEFRSRVLHQRKPGPIGNDQVIKSRGTTPARDGGALSELVMQARGLINAANRAIAASRREPPSATTAMLARIIVSEAQKQHPHDLLLQSIDLEGDSLDWDQINAAMKVVVRTLG